MLRVRVKGVEFGSASGMLTMVFEALRLLIFGLDTVGLWNKIGPGSSLM